MSDLPEIERIESKNVIWLQAPSSGSDVSGMVPLRDSPKTIRADADVHEAMAREMRVIADERELL